MKESCSCSRFVKLYLARIELGFGDAVGGLLLEDDLSGCLKLWLGARVGFDLC